MATKPHIAALLDKKMDRADFLKYIAMGALAVSGISGVLRALGIMQQQSGGAQSYGTSAYGGAKKD